MPTTPIATTSSTPATLLFISRLYLASGQTAQARQALNTLITRHPQSRDCPTALSYSTPGKVSDSLLAKNRYQHAR